MGVYAYFDASTAHITRWDARLLKLKPELTFVPGSLIVYPKACGWFIFIKEDATEQEVELQEAGFSEAFIALMAKARQNGCWWLLLDEGGDTDPALPTFNW